MLPPLAPASPGLLTLPESWSERPEIREAVTRAGLEVAGDRRAELQLLDLSSSQAWEALDALAPVIRAGQLSLLAVVPEGDPKAAARALEAGAADVVAQSRLAAELSARLLQLRARHAASREALRREADMSMLLQLTADYAGTLDVEELLHDVTRKLAQEMDIERATLVVVDEQQNAGFVIAASDDAALKDLRLELSRYPEIREVVRTGKPVIVEDAPSHPLLDAVKVQVAARGIHTIAALPLSVRGKVLGVLLLRASDRRPAFSLREIDVLATVAHATAVALRNARLLESVRGQTEREKSARIAAEERAASLARYESYYANVSDGIAILDPRGCVLSLNPAGSRLLDVDSKEALGRHINALTNLADDQPLGELLKSVSRGESRHDLDLQVRTLAGRRMTMNLSGARLREGKASAILSFRDVTASRQMADELRQTKEFLEKLIDSSVDAIIAADLRGKIILYNQGAVDICGYTPAEAIAGLDVRNLYPPGVARDVMAKLRQGKGRLGVCRQEVLSKSGERVPVNMTASILYEGEREVASVGIFTDLRARMQLERRLSETQDRLEESEKKAIIVALAGTAAHELNQPLTSVMGYAELLKRKLKEGDFAYRPVEIIYKEAERMAEIVRKIGKITRYEPKPYVGTSQIIDIDKASSHEE